ncbi:hypothetical protein SAY86_016194 [Trapa natans]|uniref:Uncharacterized protein n=1 Tax=Trapa natans TaxID=22666 RepID=A0AAN7LL00_TRANT|nr:hypothetical protein SAY86_016194 [Trapa natans]
MDRDGQLRYRLESCTKFGQNSIEEEAEQVVAVVDIFLHNGCGGLGLISSAFTFHTRQQSLQLKVKVEACMKFYSKEVA